LTKAITTIDDKALILNAYRSLIRYCSKKTDAIEKKSIRRAFEMANEAHFGMRRKSGEPYILHPIEVAKISTKEIGLGSVGVICALLHDTVEDTELTLTDIERAFDKQVSNIVNGLTKISGIFDLENSLQAENFRKLILTLADDVRVILVKIADRLHNMRTLESMPEHKQIRIASETKFLYAPLAHRLGLYAIKSELEDLSMKYTDRDTYKNIAKKLAATKKERDKYIKEFIKPIKKSLLKAGVNSFTIAGRPKSIYSIQNKILKKKVDFEEVYDLFAIRIIINCDKTLEKSLCWKIYSVITDHYVPNPDRLRDWVSTPKANGYESLHTTVMGPGGKWVEVQIRSERMNEIAEKGFAAHWKYKEDENTAEDNKDKGLDEWLTKIRETLTNPDSDALDFVRNFKLDLYQNEIYVFTPKGELKILPQGASALDFAFDIHTDIGAKCIGAKVNHKLVPISHKLVNGDQIEIITSKKQKPSEDWLKFIITSKARAKIKTALKDEKRRVALDGKEILFRKLKQLKYNPTTEFLNDLLNHFKTDDLLDFYFNIANRDINLEDIKRLEVKNNRIVFKRDTEAIKELNKIKTTKISNTPGDVILFGDVGDKLDYSMANCCQPIPGDDVFGFITIGQGIKIHRKNCPNAPDLIGNYGYRIIKTKWSRKKKIAFLSGISVTGLDNIGVIQKITNVISGDLKVNMRSISIDATEGIFKGHIMVYVDDTKQLEKLIVKLKRIDGIISASRFDN